VLLPVKEWSVCSGLLIFTKNVSIKSVAEFVGEERERAPAAAPVRAAELRAAGVAVLWAGIDAAPDHHWSPVTRYANILR
jgi:hypothetical protein